MKLRVLSMFCLILSVVLAGKVFSQTQMTLTGRSIARMVWKLTLKNPLE